MKIKTETRSFDEVMALPREPHKEPQRPNILFRSIMRLAGIPDLKAVDFRFEDRTGGLLKDPCLILMNHSSFIDLEIASRILYPQPYGIVCTSDGFVGKDWLMRHLGCIPTQKFVRDLTLIKDMQYALKQLKMHVLMYPEASYSFDGCATPLPRGLGRLLKMMAVPVIMIRTYGAFTRDPLYNCLQKRKVKVRAEVYPLASKEETETLSREELDARLDGAFSFDHFAWQQENHIAVTEEFRADGLERILYKCPVCGREGLMEGKGTAVRCKACGAAWTLDEYGSLEAEKPGTGFAHIPAWYAWEREEVKKDLENDTYLLDTPVKIGMMVDHKAIYMVGEGRLVHDLGGFTLTGCDGKLEYRQKPSACYSLYADYYWYELGDIICIGNKDALYYCFPAQEGKAAKTRMAAEELYKMHAAKA